MTNISILDYLVVLARNKRWIVRFVLAVIVVSAIVLFLLLPRWYKSNATIMAPKQKNVLGLLSGIGRTTSSLRGLGLGGSSDEIAQYLTILSSRRVHGMVANQFDLQTVYDLETMEKTIKELRSNVEISPGEEDISVEVVVFDTKPERAAAMANYYVEALNEIYLELSVTEARNNREFLENRYVQNLEDLAKAEENFKSFQKQYGVYSVPEQVKAAVEVAARLQSQVLLKRVELGILSKSLSADNPTRQAVEVELLELERQLSHLKHGGVSREALDMFTPFERIPEVGMEYLRRYRDMEIQNKLLELLLPLYEQARIEEMRNTPSLLILDKAVPAVKASKPKRLILLAFISGLSLFLAFLWALVKERFAGSNSTETDPMLVKLEFLRKEFQLKNLFR